MYRHLAALVATLIALTATVTVDAQPVGSRQSPAPIGTPVTVTTTKLFVSYEAEVTVLDVLRGDAAWERVRDANPFNEPARDGHEYLLARIRVKLLAIDDPEAALNVSTVDFRAVSAAGREYEPVIAVIPPAPVLKTTLYAGASHEGWALFEVAADDPAPVIVYGRDYLGRGGIWFVTR